ncbi:DEAD/DEAH box helicase family protein [Muricauda sp. SCSIO 64092]|uniref:DEAD/DEAH box helicase family protein n=1 Tax=Allomuricauda sp. SCSIO 64092 TaxID=2908842 RepID=UPI001FF480FF|nr:DEAD/DEAH box helicase family protein [Muricauda sp. SCSIO 64092]UOY05750.1 DEAD/DEAH box helicase family protein [Muricauda sp. SCSIO 64092]
MENTQTLELASSDGQLLLEFSSFNELEVKEGNLKNIQNMLPELFPEQQKDVQKAERRFKKGKGILFTNGTGTGKTFTGLGIIKRFIVKNKRNILIVVPTDKKARDWIIEGQVLNLEIRLLENTKDCKPQTTVTTYANFYQNKRLSDLNFDLVVYDECHYLLQNGSGNYTECLWKHKQVAKLPSTFEQKYHENIRQAASYEKDGKSYVDNDVYKSIYNQRLAEYINATKVVFLSASPFAYHKSIMLGDGCLWDIREKPYLAEYVHGSYNEPDDYEKFFIEHFGYRMRYNKLTTPDSHVNVGLMERNFYEKFRKEGIISGRKIQVEKDYSRDFIIVNSEIGKRIDQGKELFHSSDFSDRYKYLAKYQYRKFNYNYTNQLLECIKAKEVICRIEQHLKLGRKVVIFHNYNNSLPSHPFHFEANKLIKSEEELVDKIGLYDDIQRFNKEYPEFVNLDLSNLVNPRQTIINSFPNALEINGTISKKKRIHNINLFNDNCSKYNLLLVQTKAGKEGISLHDKIGGVNRVLLTLGLPTAPTDAIQIEGRIYRIGLMSNAIYEYITLQTNFERFAFAEKIATRSRTAENLAMGEQARNLELVFTEGYLNAHDELPSSDQGTGGKSSDLEFETISEFDKAKTYYFGTGKRTASNKSREGTDYFATPEPLGLKMVEWLDPKPGQSLLEPSAGHGAIGRFFPENTVNTFIEPSYTLCSKLSMNVNGAVKAQHFENLSIWNKYQGIAMNPPFGSAGKTAMEHVAKAVKHLSKNDRSKVIAIIPNGASMEKRLNKFFAHPDNRDIHLSCEIVLPSVVFERSGTRVGTKMIVIENQGSNMPKRNIDLSIYEDINAFFDAIENLKI